MTKLWYNHKEHQCLPSTPKHLGSTHKSPENLNRILDNFKIFVIYIIVYLIWSSAMKNKWFYLGNDGIIGDFYSFPRRVIFLFF